VACRRHHATRVRLACSIPKFLFHSELVFIHFTVGDRSHPDTARACALCICFAGFPTQVPASVDWPLRAELNIVLDSYRCLVQRLVESAEHRVRNAFALLRLPNSTERTWTYKMIALLLLCQILLWYPEVAGNPKNPFRS
jgi:hypothetical protein